MPCMQPSAFVITPCTVSLRRLVCFLPNTMPHWVLFLNYRRTTRGPSSICSWTDCGDTINICANLSSRLDLDLQEDTYPCSEKLSLLQGAVQNLTLYYFRTLFLRSGALLPMTLAYAFTAWSPRNLKHCQPRIASGATLE